MATKTSTKTTSSKPEKQTITKADAAAVPAEIAKEQPKAKFAPLTSEALKGSGIGRQDKWGKGQALTLSEDCLVLVADDHTEKDAPKLLLKRVGKRGEKLTEAQKSGVLPKGTKMTYVGRSHVRTRIGESKGERGEVKVRLDVFSFVIGEETFLVCGTKDMVEVAA